jgi:hypothetical protein
MSKARDIASAAPAPAGVTSTELGYVDGVTSAIQTQLDAKTAKSTLTTTGDIYYASAANTPARLGIGTASQLLAVNSGATAPEWVAAPSSGGMTLLSTTNLSGTSTTVSSINQTHSELFIVVTGAVNSDFFAKLRIQANGSTTLSKTAGVTFAAAGFSSAAGVVIDTNVSTTSTYLRIPNYASTTVKKQGFFVSSNNDTVGATGSYFYDATTAISSIVVTTTAGTPTFTAGQIQIYGVK